MTVLSATEVPTCPDCGDSHLGRCGGLTFAQRLRSVRLDTSVVDSRSRKNYYDSEPIKDMFGDDSQERYMDETKGRGHVAREDFDKLSPADFDFYTGADKEEDGNRAF
jgi:hypothetical protein